MVLLEGPHLFYGTKYAFTAMLFTTPYIMLSVLFSCAYIFMVRHEEKTSPAQLSLYPDPAMRNELFLAIGEIHNPRRAEPLPIPQWLIVPSAVYSPGSPSSEPLEAVRQVVVFIHLQNSSWPIALGIRNAVLRGSCWK